MFELFFNILTVLTNSSNVFVCLCLIQESVYKKFCWLILVKFYPI